MIHYSEYQRFILARGARKPTPENAQEKPLTPRVRIYYALVKTSIKREAYLVRAHITETRLGRVLRMMKNIFR